MTMDLHSLSLNRLTQSENDTFPVYVNTFVQGNEDQMSIIYPGPTSRTEENNPNASGSSPSDSGLKNFEGGIGSDYSCSATHENPNDLLGISNSPRLDHPAESDGVQACADPSRGTEGRSCLDDYRCPICLDTLINTVRVDCSYGHRFCNFCISSWIAVSRHLVTECPVCSGAIFGKTLDLKTDADIRGIFERMSESQKTARLLSIKERLQMEYPRLSNSCFPTAFYQNMLGNRIHAGLSQFSYEHNYGNSYYQPQYRNFQYQQHNQPQPGLENTDGTRQIATEGTSYLNSSPQEIHEISDNFAQTHQGNSVSQHNEAAQTPIWVPEITRESPEASNILQEAMYSEVENGTEQTENSEIQYQHFRYENHQSSRWNNNLYLTPDDNRVATEAQAWSQSSSSDAPSNVDNISSGINTAPRPQFMHPSAERIFQASNNSYGTHQSHQSLGTEQPINYHRNHWAGHQQHRISSTLPQGPCVFHANNPAGHHHTEAWRYQQHQCSLTPVLFPCPPVLPSPIHYSTTCAVAHCYFAPCPVHTQLSHHQHATGLVHMNCNRNYYPNVEVTPIHPSRNCSTSAMMQPNIPGRNSPPIQLPSPNIQGTNSHHHRVQTSSSLPSSPTAGSPRSRVVEEDQRRRRRHYHRTVVNSFGGLSPRSYTSASDTNINGRNGISSRVASCPVLSHGSHFSGGFSLFSRGYVGFQISHLPAHDRRVVAPPGRITHPLVSLTPLNSDGTSARVTLTFDVHRV